MRTSTILLATLALSLGSASAQAAALASLEIVDPGTIVEKDDVQISSVALEGDVLVIDVGYSGGCKAHDFNLFWDGNYAKSLPTQLGLVLVHDGNDDFCESLRHETLRFDVSALRAAVLVALVHVSNNELSMSVLYDGLLPIVKLDGRTYSRTVVSGGLFGQPVGERTHALNFDAAFATDNANTFFGNPPAAHEYTIVGNLVTFNGAQYVLSADGSSMTQVETGAFFTFNAPVALAGLTFTRIFETAGFFGQPAGTFTHSLSFGDTVASDDGNTFFGNPPESAPYTVDGRLVTIATDGSLAVYELSLDGKQLTQLETGAVFTLVE